MVPPVGRTCYDPSNALAEGMGLIPDTCSETGAIPGICWRDWQHNRSEKLEGALAALLYNLDRFLTLGFIKYLFGFGLKKWFWPWR